MLSVQRSGARRFTAEVLAENKPMLAVFHNSGLPVKTEFDGDAYSLTMDLRRDHRTVMPPE